MTYTPPPPMAQPAQPAGKDNTKLFGWIGIVGGLCFGLLGFIFGGLSIWQAKKWGTSPVLGYIAVGIGILGIIWNSIYFSRR